MLFAADGGGVGFIVLFSAMGVLHWFLKFSFYDPNAVMKTLMYYGQNKFLMKTTMG